MSGFYTTGDAMSIKHEPTVKKYEALRSDLLAAIANLQEFAQSLTDPISAFPSHVVLRAVVRFSM